MFIPINTKFFKLIDFAILIIFIMTMIAGCSKSTNPKKPDPDLKLITVSDADTDVALILENKQYEKIVVMADKTSNGDILSITGGAYVDSSGNSCAFWFGDDGLPEYMVANSWLFRLYNYTENTVDLIGIDPNGNWNHWLEVAVNAEVLDSLRGLMASRPVSFSAEETVKNTFTGGKLSESAFEYSDFVHWVTMGIEAAACVIGIATAETGIGLGIAYSACGSTLVNMGIDLMESSSTIEYTCEPNSNQDVCEPLGIVMMSLVEDEDILNEKDEMTQFYRRITLTWGANPRDLDSHLWTPSIGGHSYHVYFSSKGSENSPPYAELDVDDVSSYGPENITIKQLFSGTYYYSVYHYSGTGTITTSGANVKVYGPQGDVLNSLNVPSGSVGSNWWWNVLKIDGSTGQITIVNEISSSPPSGVPAKKLNYNTTKGY